MKLVAKKREIKGEKTRKAGSLPGVVYGASLETLSIDLDPIAYTKVYNEVGESSLIDLEIDGKDAGKVLIQDVQYEPVKNRALHVDLRRIEMGKPMITNVSLKFIGIAPAVKDFGGILIKSLDEVEIKCLPKDLLSHIDVDLTALATFDNNINVGDLKLPEGVEILSPDVETVLVSVTAPLSDEQIEAMEAEDKDVADVEVEGEKKEEGAEGEEGEKKEEGEGEKKEEKK